MKKLYFIFSIIILIGSIYFYRSELFLMVVRQKLTNPQFSYTFDLFVSPKDPYAQGYLKENRETFKFFETKLIGNTMNVAGHLVRELYDYGSESKLAVWRPKVNNGAKFGVAIHYPGGGNIKIVPHPLGESSLVPVLFDDEHDWVIVDVAYKLCPEFSIEKSLDDSYLAYKWVIDNADKFNIDITKIIVFGESAGTIHSVDVAIRSKKRITSSQSIVSYSTLRKGGRPSFTICGKVWIWLWIILVTNEVVQ
jgi:acetyl esterase/lipase